MIIEIHRNNYSKHGIEGTLIVNSKVIGATVEHPRHYVPAGPYPIELERSKKFGCLMPTLPCSSLATAPSISLTGASSWARSI